MIQELPGMILVAVLGLGGLGIMLSIVRPRHVVGYLVGAILLGVFLQNLLLSPGWFPPLLGVGVVLFVGMRLLQRMFRLWLGTSAGDQLTAQIAYDLLRWLWGMPRAAFRLLMRFRQ